MCATRVRALSLAATSAVAGLSAALLSACYVVPIDPRTGQAYPIAAPYPHDGAPARVTVIAPPVALGAPLQSVLTARMYPLNAQANSGGLLSAVVVDNHTGRGSFTLVYLGDTLQGEATRVDAGYAPFGRIHNEVFGPLPRSFSGRRGIANGFGARGVNAQCEYLVTGPGMGTGACVFSDGAKYQMHFGG